MRRHRAGTVATPASYDAFVSYSHAADGRLAPALQRGLERLARPWYRVRALRVFRDDTGLAVNPHLWASIQTAMDDSAWFVLLCSPEAAASPWVNREIDHWVAHRDADRILPVLTDGTLSWDPARGDYELQSSALPSALEGRFTDEPRHLDLRWARDEEQLDLRHSRFREAVADLAAPLHGIPKEELESEDVRQHRRVRRLARGAVGVLALFLVIALVASALAILNAREAHRQAAVANARGLAGQAVARARSAPDQALLLAVEARRHDDSVESRSALLAVVQRTSRLERLVTGFSAGDVVTGLSDDGRTVALSDTRGGVTLVGVASPKRRRAFKTHQRGRVAAFFSRDGNQVATTSDDTTVRVWDVRSGRPVTPSLRGHDYPVHQAAFSPEGRLLVTEDNSGRGVVWSVPAGRRVTTVPMRIQSSAAEPTVHFSADGRYLAVVGIVTSVFDVTTMAPVLDLPPRPFASQPRTAAFSPDGALLAVPSTTEGVVELWDLRSGVRREGTGLRVEEGASVSTLAFSPDDSTLVGGLGNGAVTFWKLGSGGVAETLAGNRGPVTHVAFGPEASKTITASDTGVAVWNLRSTALTTRTRLEPDILAFVGLDFSPDNRTLMVIDDRARVWLLDPSTLKPLRAPFELSPSYPTGYIAATFGPDGRFLAVTTGVDVAYLDVSTGALRARPIAVPEGTGGVDISPDGREIAVGGVDGSVAIIDTRQWKIRRRSPLHGLGFTRVAFSPDGRLLASEGGDGRLVLEDTTLKHPTTVAQGRTPLSDIDFSPDGRYLAAGFGDGTTIIVDVARRQTVGAPLGGSAGTILSLAFSPDGRLLAVADQAGSVALWDVKTRQRIGELGGRVHPTLSVGIAPSGRAVASTGLDGEILVSNIDPNAWVRRACAIVGRNLTRVEWRQFVGDAAYHKTCPQWPSG